MGKKLYTFLFAACAAAMSASLPASAEENGPRLIREDRVWEYVYSEYEQTPTFGKDADWGQQLFRVKFDGTEQHGEHVYHRLVHTGDLIRWTMKYDYATDDMVFVAREDLPNDNNRVYLMREEEGRVYMLNRDFDYISNDEFMPDEFLVYDFNKTQGESYDSWIGLWYWNGIPFEVMDYQFNVKTTETIEIDGEQCTVQNFTLLDDLSIIEGIGFVEHGFLSFLFCDMRTHIGGCMDCDLNRVYDAEGNIIYRGKDIDPETVSVDRVSAQSSAAIDYDGATLTAVGRDGSGITLMLLDVSGKVMSRISGVGTVSASASELSPGVYVAVAEVDGSAVARRKFVVR